MDDEETVERLQVLVTESPFDTKLLHRLAAAHYKAKDYPSSVRILQRILRFEKKSSTVFGLLADCYYLMKEEEKSCQALEDALTCPTPSRGSICLRLGLLYTKHGDYEQGADALTKAIMWKQDENNMYKAKFALGRCQEGLSELPKAIDIYRKIGEIASNPGKKASCMGAISRCLLKLNEKEQCINTLNAAESLVPGDSKLLKLRAWCYYTSSDFDLALSCLKHAISNLHYTETDRADFEFLLGCSLVKTGNAQEACEYFSSAGEKQPNSPLLWSFFAIAYAYLQKYDQAYSCLIRSLQLNPKNTDNLLNLAVIYEICGMKKASETVILKARELIPDVTERTELEFPHFEVGTEILLNNSKNQSLKKTFPSFCINFSDFPSISLPSNRGTKTPSTSPCPSPQKRSNLTLPAISPVRTHPCCKLPVFNFVDVELQDLVDSAGNDPK